jgi:predicted alpha-1,2-mannosidase
MNKIFPFLAFSIYFNSLFSQNLTQYINPMIGTGGHGHTFPGPTLPFAMVQLSPDTRVDGSWDGCSGYHYSDNTIYGFSHTHLSGTGCSDYGDIAFMPYFGADVFTLSIDKLIKKGVQYAHQNEIAKAGYYSVVLDNKVKVELTTTTRSGIQKYSFQEKGHTKIVLNLKHRDELLKGKINEIDVVTFSGLRESKAWAERQRLYFYFNLSRLPLKSEIIKGSKGDELLVLEYDVKNGDEILIKTGISGTDEAGAIGNLDGEMPNFDFEKYRINANAIWNAQMMKIKTYGGTETEKYNFYTALYHSMIHPSIFSDIDNRYRGRDGKVYNTEGEFDYYTVFSLWDTYRALHPLLSVIEIKRTNDFIHTFIKQHEQVGKLPIWELWSNETNCMIGYHAVSVIWDSYAKSIRAYNPGKAFKAMRDMAKDTTNPAVKSYMTYGYVRADDDAESVSKTLEYAYNDWCISQMALKLGFSKDYNEFSNRSRNWINVFDPQTGFMRPRLNSTQMTPFTPYMVDNNFTEANSYQYSFYVPHDLPKFKQMLGGEKAFERKLDELFSAKSKTEGREQADITGLIGQYAHGNEPSHHIAFLYKDRAKRTSIVKQIRDNFYKNTPDGLIGNEDCGQMSAWYVWAAMGMYPVCPGDKHMTRCDAIFDSVEIKADVWTIHSEKGDTTEFFNMKDQHLAVEEINLDIQRQPYIEPCQKIFKDKQWIKLAGGDKIKYSINDEIEKAFKDSILIDKTCQVKFYTEIGEQKTNTQIAQFYQLPNDRTVTLNCTYNPQYHAGGPMGLVDGIYGNENWRKGDWLGFQSQNFETIITLNESKPIKEISTTFLSDQRSWIFYPTEYKISTSIDGVKYDDVFTIGIEVPRADDKNYVKRMNHKLNTEAKYIKIWAKNYGKIPDWHPGAGGDAFIFVDEVEVK